LLARELQHQLERVVLRAILGTGEDDAVGGALGLAAEALNADVFVRRRRGFLAELRRFLAGLEAVAGLPGVGDGAAVAADRAEQVRVFQAEREAAEAAHRQAVDGPALAPGD